ncbi:unnamed protein product [Rotaria sordida]|uniref:Uncharacterized protein n=1 Tax=Rotaria sordida TaxID=392033 RepID=A0A813NAW5_9BILA|nr:unnamed protein product [Rotaria sordida]CAF1135727.1 unnamed protein product [Rotaria sordida]
MRFTGIFLLLIIGASIDTVSPLTWNDFISKLKEIFNIDPLAVIKDKACSYFAEHPDRANITLIRISEILRRTNETTQLFDNTLTFINTPENQLKLVNGTSGCPTFFDEFKNALVSDYQRVQPNLENARQNAVNKIKEFYNAYKLW